MSGPRFSDVMGGVVIDNLGFMMNGYLITLFVSAMAICLSVVIGTLLAVARVSKVAVFRYPVILYIEVLRSTPLIMVIFWVFFLLPKLTRTPFSPLASGLMALVLLYSTHVAEIVRAGIQAIPRGQMEAGLASGLGYVACMRCVILPQAIRHMIPALITRFTAILQGTSLLVVIGVIEFFGAATIVNNREFKSVEIYGFVAFVYFVSCFLVSRLGLWCERRLGVRGSGSVGFSLST